MEVLQIDKLNCVCCFNQKGTCVLQWRCFYPNLCWKITQSTVSRMKKTHDSLLATTCLFIVFLLTICTEIKKGRWNIKTFQFFHQVKSVPVDMNYIPVFEDVSTLIILLYYIDFADGNIIGDFARKMLHKHVKTVWLMRYNNHSCHKSNIRAVCQTFRYPSCDTFCNKSLKLEL